MALSANARVTWKAAVMAAISNILAQSMSLRSQSKHLWTDPSAYNYNKLAYFVLYALIATPPNFEWQMWLERAFPGTISVPKHKIDARTTGKVGEGPSLADNKMSVKNVLIKFLADQIVGGTINSLAFIAFFAFIDGKDISAAIGREFWPMRVASCKLWPAVSLLNYTVIPAEYRINFANLIGIGWGVYLSLLSL